MMLMRIIHSPDVQDTGLTMLPVGFGKNKQSEAIWSDQNSALLINPEHKQNFSSIENLIFSIYDPTTPTLQPTVLVIVYQGSEFLSAYA